MSLHLRPVSETEFALVQNVEVEPDQTRFSGTVAQAFEEAEEGVDFHALFEADQPVGFFKLDQLYHQQYDFVRAQDLGLRAFMIDRRCQGRGLATAAVKLLPAYVPQHYPDRHSVILTVNLQNPAAIACYLKGGFTDTGEIVAQGLAGPQHILQLPLHPLRKSEPHRG